jgi:hypothetical protein
MDLEIRKILNEYKIHFKLACMEILYLKRKEMGRGLTNINHKSEVMLLNMKTSFENSSVGINRKRSILMLEKKNTTQLGIIQGYLVTKYKLKDETIDSRIIVDQQKENLKKGIEIKKLHQQIFELSKSNTTGMMETTNWLRRGNNSPKTEGLYCYIQDRNVMFGDMPVKCRFCKEVINSVNHVATNCTKMLNGDYKNRHGKF